MLKKEKNDKFMDVEDDPYTKLFEPNGTAPRPVNKSTSWKSELDIYRAESRPKMNSNPLEWWKVNQLRFPVLG